MSDQFDDDSDAFNEGKTGDDDTDTVEIDRQILGLQDWDTLLLMAEAPYLVVRREALLQARVQLKDYLNAHGVRCSEGRITSGVKQARDAGLLEPYQADAAMAAIRVRNKWAYYEVSTSDSWDATAAQELRDAVIDLHHICAPEHDFRYAPLAAQARASAGLQTTPPDLDPTRTPETMTAEQLERWRLAWRTLAAVALGAVFVALILAFFEERTAPRSRTPGAKPESAASQSPHHPSSFSIPSFLLKVFIVGTFGLAIADCLLHGGR